MGVQYRIWRFFGYLVLLLTLFRLAVFLGPIFYGFRRVPTQLVLLELGLNSF